MRAGGPGQVEGQAAERLSRIVADHAAQASLREPQPEAHDRGILHVYRGRRGEERVGRGEDGLHAAAALADVVEPEVAARVGDGAAPVAEADRDSRHADHRRPFRGPDLAVHLARDAGAA